MHFLYLGHPRVATNVPSKEVMDDKRYLRNCYAQFISHCQFEIQVFMWGSPIDCKSIVLPKQELFE